MNPKSYKPKMPPKGIRHKELTNGTCRVIVAPIKWRTLNGNTSVTEACAYCKDCGWDTPKLFSFGAAEAAAKNHLGFTE